MWRKLKEKNWNVYKITKKIHNVYKIVRKKPLKGKESAQNPKCREKISKIMKNVSREY